MLTVSLDGLSSSCILCGQCWHNRETLSTLGTQDTGSIVYLHPVSCVPNVDSVSRLFIFILYLVCPMLTLSLDCLSSSCILCTQCWQCLSIVYLHPVSCVPNVDIVSRVFIYIPYLVCPMLTVSLDCLSSSCILCTQCWQCLSIVYLHPVSCVPNVDSVSRVFIFILFLVSQCWHCLSMVCLHPVSCVPNVDSVSRLFIFILYLVCLMLTVSLECLSSSCSCVPMLTLSLDGLSSSCILCAQCWQCLSIVCLHPVSCVPNVDIVSRLFIFILYLVYPMLTVSLDCFSSSCILCPNVDIVSEDKQSRDNVNIGHTRYRMKINNRETLSTLGTQDTGSIVYLHPVSCVPKCWHCLSIVYLHPVSCVPNVDSVSRLFIFILYLVCPMLTLSLDCLSSSCILCTQCWQCLSIVYLHPVSCVPNVDIVSRVFIYILYLVCPMLTVSLDCLSSSCILCTQCWQCLSIVYLHPVSCVPNVDSVSRVFIFILFLVSQCWHCLSMVCLHLVSCVPNVDSVSRLFVFILYLVYPMLTLSLDCLSSSCILCTQCWQCLSIVYLHPVSCVPNVDIVSRLFIFILYLVYPMLTASLDCLSSSCILCTQRWQFLSIIYLHPVSCVPNVDIVSRVFIFILYLVCPMLTLSLDCLSSSCILCTQCWQCLSIVYLHPVSCVPNVDSVSRVFIFILYLVSQCWQCLSMVCLHPVSCVPNVGIVSRLFIFILYLVYPMLTQSRDTVNIGYTRYRIDCLSSSCILCAQCWHCLSSVYLHPVSCVPNVDIVSRLFIFILYLVYPMLTASLDCLSSSCILCTQCWQCLSIIYLHPVSCVPNVDIVSRLFIFILYLVYPMLTVSLDCLSSSCILCAQCWHCLSSVYLHPVSCVPNVDSVSRLFIFILYLVYPMLTQSRDTVNIGYTRYRIDCLSSSCICVCLMLTVSLECLSSSCFLCPNVDIVSRCLSSSCILCAQCWQCFSIVCLHPVSCVPMLTLSLDCLSSSCILCTQCWQCLSIVYLHPVSCVPNVDIVSRCLSSSCILCTQCWQRLSIVCLHPVSCVPNVYSFSRLFIFILYLVCPMLTLSLECLSSSCILCAQCWHCLSIVYLHPVSCVPNVDSVSRLFIFILYLVYPMLTVSLDCLSSSCILCTQCWHCLSIVYLHPVSCVPNVDIVSRVFIFILYLVYPMLTLSLDCLSSSCILCAQCWQCLSIVYLHPVSCVPNVDTIERHCQHWAHKIQDEDKHSRDNVNIGHTRYRIDCLSSFCIFCTQCWHCLSIVYLHPVSCVPNVDIVSRVFIFILYLVCPMLTVSLDCLSSSCILCTQCWHCLSIVYLHPVSCVPNVDSVSLLFIFILYLVCLMLTVSLECLSSSCILCPNVDSVSRWFVFILYLVWPMLTQSRDTVNIGYTRYRIDCLSSSCILCTQCWQCLSIIYLHPVSCVPNVDIVSRLFIFILYLVYPMLTVSLDCLSSSCILCAQCWHCLSSVYLHPVSCVPNVDSVSRLFIFILYLVYPMLTVSLDCLSSSCILCA